MGIKQFNLVALLDFLNCIGSNGPTYNTEMSHFAGVVMHSCFFDNVSLWEKQFLGPDASQEVVITKFDHSEHWLQSLLLFLGAWCKCTSI